MIEAVGVVVPARNEEALLPACLASLSRAAGHPELAGIRVRVIVVLDGCTDRSAQVAHEAGVTSLAIDAGNVGVARAAGFAEVFRLEDALPADRLWLASTDADSTVPHDWLARQLRYAAGGADVVVGTVHVADWSGHSAAVVRRFAALYGSSGPHGHVHGANLGVRALTYRSCGGVAPLALAEDHALVEACAAVGGVIVRPRDLPVVTSARRAARAVGGFADLLVGLAADLTIT